MPGRGHERQGGVEHVEVALEVHVEHRQPVLLGALGEVGLPGDAGHVDDGVEPAVLVDQLARTGRRTASPSVTDTDEARAEPPAATMRPAVVSSRLGELLGAVEGDQGVDGDDEPAATAELLGDGRSDPAPAAGDDGDPLTPAHDAVDRTSSSRPSKVPASSHCSSSSR